ncbi:hypothetical protein BKA70DRAFT_1423720 [Coprinopsis sp. MPI-PUGE-AT-0042]|nr:hypothetical protein BKA70DRAFT_1423720 [Coprinopsis sp. MPI-PUGE-AT-0042]
MDHTRRSRGDDRYRSSTNGAHGRGHPYGWGNFPDMYSLPPYVPTHTSHDDYRYDAYERTRIPVTERLLVLQVASVLKGILLRCLLDRLRERVTSQRPEGDTQMSRIRHEPSLVKFFGCENRASLEDEGSCEMIFDDDPSFYLQAALPQIPEDIDGLVTGRIVLGSDGQVTGSSCCGKLETVEWNEQGIHPVFLNDANDHPCGDQDSSCRRPKAYSRHEGKPKSQFQSQDTELRRDKHLSGTSRLSYILHPPVSLYVLADTNDIDLARRAELEDMALDDLKELNENEKLVKKLAEKDDAFLASEVLGYPNSAREMEPPNKRAAYLPTTITVTLSSDSGYRIPSPRLQLLFSTYTLILWRTGISACFERVHRSFRLGNSKESVGWIVIQQQGSDNESQQYLAVDRVGESGMYFTVSVSTDVP